MEEEIRDDCCDCDEEEEDDIKSNSTFLSVFEHQTPSAYNGRLGAEFEEDGEMRDDEYESLMWFDHNDTFSEQCFNQFSNLHISEQMVVEEESKEVPIFEDSRLHFDAIAAPQTQMQGFELMTTVLPTRQRGFTSFVPEGQNLGLGLSDG